MLDSSSSESKSSKMLPPPKGRMLDSSSSSSYSKSSKTLPEKGRMLDSSSSSRFSKSAKSEGSGRALKSKHCHKESVMSSKSAKSLLHFDDVIKGTGWGYMPNQYKGLDWSRMGVIYHKYFNYLSGYEAGNVSPDYTMWTYSGGVSTISSATSFSVYSLFATPAWSTGMDLEILAYRDGSNLVGNYTTVLGAPSDGPYLHCLSSGRGQYFKEINRLEIRTSGGDLGYNRHLAIDDVVVSGSGVGVTAIQAPQIAAASLVIEDVDGVAGPGSLP